MTNQPRYARERDILPQREITQAEAEQNRQILQAAKASKDKEAIRKASQRPRRARSASSGVLSISKSSFWNLVAAGKLTAIKLGPRTTVFDIAEVEALIASK